MADGKFDVKAEALDLTRNVSTWLDWGPKGVRALQREIEAELAKAKSAGFAEAREKALRIVAKHLEPPHNKLVDSKCIDAIHTHIRLKVKE